MSRPEYGRICDYEARSLLVSCENGVFLIKARTFLSFFSPAFVLLFACGTPRPAAPQRPDNLHAVCQESGCGEGLRCIAWRECNLPPIPPNTSGRCEDRQTCEIRCSSNEECPDGYYCVLNRADTLKNVCDR